MGVQFCISRGCEKMGLGTIPHIKRTKGGEEHLQVKKQARVVQLIE